MRLKVPLLLGGFVSVPSVLVGLTWGTSGDLQVYSFQGSSSMKAVVDYLIKQYSNSESPIFGDIQAIGSNSGLQRILDGHADFALVSQDVTELAKKNKDKWDAQKLRTITLGREAMVLLYKPPKNCSGVLDINKDNVKYIYSAFSGHKEKSVQEFDWKYLLNKDGDRNNGCHGKIIPWAKSAGPSRSGTAYAFVDNPLLIVDDEKKDKDWIDKVKESYGKDTGNIKYTSESNLVSWNSFSNSLAEGSMIYLPSSFVSTNIENINANEVRIAKLNGKEFSDTKDYPWGRTYNLIYSTKDFIKDTPTTPTKLKKQQFVEWLLKNLNKVQNMGLTPVEDQKKEANKSDIEISQYGVPFSTFQKSATQPPLPR